MKAKTVKLETYNKVKTELDKANLQIKELTAIAEKRASEVAVLLEGLDESEDDKEKLEEQLDDSKQVAEVFKNKYQALNQAVKAMANANDNILFKC